MFNISSEEIEIEDFFFILKEQKSKQIYLLLKNNNLESLEDLNIEKNNLIIEINGNKYINPNFTNDILEDMKNQYKIFITDETNIRKIFDLDIKYIIEADKKEEESKNKIIKSYYIDHLLKQDKINLDKINMLQYT